MYEILYKRPARKALQKMPRSIAKSFLAAFEAIARDPFKISMDTKQLRGRPEYRLRIGDWRALYRLEDDRLIVIVLNIGARGDIYK